MTELPYTYTDVDGDTIKIEDGSLLATATGDDVAVYVALPDRAKDAVALVRAILHAADVGTEYRVISEDWQAGEALVLSDAVRDLSAIRERADLDARGGHTLTRAEADRLRLLEMVDHLRVKHSEVRKVSMDCGAKLARAEAEIRASSDSDSAYDSGFADGLRMGAARAEDKRLSDLEEQFTDLADLTEKLRADLGQAYAAAAGVGKALQDHITAHQVHAVEVERRLEALDGESP
ncbi:hypothetical protein [Nocardiopsis alba]|uniref:Uncharacterized protein n=1 Tax=Nocardiopsis alba TaxID=53437 RepID=A0A7K2IL65_9ACTN|nr:hypothetical protein [Nocardiopsis alba]MYR30701.1 hypothetical protein [Nocardiopsis alba]MYR30773.1 hypothetical protein [Nocardiopsis alba]